MSKLAIFIEGLLSFLSPCVLPLIPLYVSYLAGDNKEIDEQGNISYKQTKVFIMTIFFVLGICLTFVLLSLTVNYIGQYLNQYSEIISIIGGTVIIIFGLHQTGLIHIDVLEKQLKFKNNSLINNMNYLKAFLLGFVFSLGWSPCIGPMLANAILLATTNNDFLYILIYGLGLVIPFVITGLFTSTILNFINKNKKLMKYTLLVAGLIMICFGFYMIYNASKTIIANKNINQIATDSDDHDHDHEEIEDLQAYLYNYEFINTDGKKIKLADYKGKYIVLNFTTTWCNFCIEEIPIYKEFSENEELKCFYVMSPLNERTDNAIENFIKEHNISVETIKDEEGILFYYCGISGYPTTYIISPDGEFIVYYAGALDMNGFNDILAYAKDKVENE